MSARKTTVLAIAIASILVVCALVGAIIYISSNDSNNDRPVSHPYEDGLGQEGRAANSMMCLNSNLRLHDLTDLGIDQAERQRMIELIEMEQADPNSITVSMMEEGKALLEKFSILVDNAADEAINRVNEVRDACEDTGYGESSLKDTLMSMTLDLEPLHDIICDLYGFLNPTDHFREYETIDYFNSAVQTYNYILTFYDELRDMLMDKSDFIPAKLLDEEYNDYLHSCPEEIEYWL